MNKFVLITLAMVGIVAIMIGSKTVTNGKRMPSSQISAETETVSVSNLPTKNNRAHIETGSVEWTEIPIYVPGNMKILILNNDNQAFEVKDRDWDDGDSIPSTGGNHVKVDRHITHPCVRSLMTGKKKIDLEYFAVPKNS